MNTACFDRIAGQIPKFGQLLLSLPPEIKSQIFDIHFKAEQPISVCGRFGVMFITKAGALSRSLSSSLICISKEELQSIFVQACAHSVFSHEHEISRGYISMNSSCRAGVCGTAVIDGERVKSVRDVSSLVFRIPREAAGCADMLFTHGEISSGVLVAGAPSGGKTTFLRDIISSLSVGKFGAIHRTAVLDERGELGAGFNLGPCADVLQGYPKAESFDIAIRMLSPEFIVCDELSPGDLPIVEQSVFSGVSLVASVHAARNDFLRRPLCKNLLRTGAFGTIVFLKGRSCPGEIEAIEKVGSSYEGFGSIADNLRQPLHGAKPSARAQPKGRGAA